jgi:hypothetical protein
MFIGRYILDFLKNLKYYEFCLPAFVVNTASGGGGKGGRGCE